MKREFETTEAQDLALAIYSKKEGVPEDEIFNRIVNADMETLVKNSEAVSKDQLFDTYQKATPEDKAAIDAVVSKATPVDAKPVPVVVTK